MQCRWPHIVHRIGEGNGRYFGTAAQVVVVVQIVVHIIVQVIVHVGGVTDTDGVARCSGPVLPEVSGPSAVLGDGRIYWT